MSTAPLFAIRPWNKEKDYPFVMSSWVKPYKAASINCPVSREIYSLYQHKRSAEILKISEVTVACNLEEPDQIFGYAIHRRGYGDHGILTWIYVKDSLRNFGVAKALFKSIQPITYCTHIGKMLQSYKVQDHDNPGKLKRITPVEKFGLIYHPYLDQEWRENVLQQGEK